MRDAIRKLPRDSPLRELIEDSLRLHRPTAQDFTRLLSALQPQCRWGGRAAFLWTFEWPEPLVAAWALGQAKLSPEQEAAAATALCEAVEACPVRSMESAARRAGVCFGLIAALTLALFGWLFFSNSLQQRDALFLFLLCLMAALLTYAPFILAWTCYEERQRSFLLRETAIAGLERLRAAESVGTLAWAALDPNQRIRKAAHRALHQTLPGLTAAHYGHLPSETIPRLCRLLDRLSLRAGGFTETLTLQLLTALEMAGDGRAVRSVQRLAEKGAGARQQEARRILPLLRERLERENDQGMLLRIAAPPAGPDSLLRPTSGTETTPPEELLRPRPLP
jgi:hypothetical protein